ncbi:MAG: CotH kinase family protein, partial [bacterium]|nr:CotH kinase family protein [bacterium]
NISPEDLMLLNSYLPEDPIFGRLEEDNKVFVNGFFAAPDYKGEVEVKYRGLNVNHWSSLKKSLRIKFPDDHFFEGMSFINFVSPRDRSYIASLLNMYRAEKLGLTNLKMYFVRLNVNGYDTGVYLAFEHWSPEWLAKKNLPEGKIFRNSTDVAESIDDYKNIFDEAGDIEKEELKNFLELVNKADDQTLKKLLPYVLDLDKFYAWNVLNILAGSNHQTEAQNAVIYFNSATGKLEIIPWDTNIGDPTGNSYQDNVSFLVNRVMSIREFREKRNALLQSYIENPKNLEDDLAFYDELYEVLRTDFLKDSYKFKNNFQFLNEVKVIREMISDNFSQAKDILEKDQDYYVFAPVDGGPVFSNSFEGLRELGVGVYDFLVKHPQFYFINEKTIGLSGNQVFTRNVYIPSGLKVKINPGSELFLDAGVSILSYSSVEISGTPANPVMIKRLYPAKAWGAFAVVNALDNKSIVSHVVADGGSGAKINGIVFTGMMAFHNSDVEVSNSVFKNALDDDGLNIKLASGFVASSSFINNAFDDLDVDFSEGNFKIVDNTFTASEENVGGDGIDISYSDIHIARNTIEGHGDKCISVGEKSTPLIENNILARCMIGIAVKDLSQATIINNTFSENEIAISLYQKKSEFGGGYAQVSGAVFQDNGKNVEFDDLSKIEFLDNSND